MIQCIIILQGHADHHVIDDLILAVRIIIHDIALLQAAALRELLSRFRIPP